MHYLYHNQIWILAAGPGLPARPADLGWVARDCQVYYLFSFLPILLSFYSKLLVLCGIKNLHFHSDIKDTILSKLKSFPFYNILCRVSRLLHKEGYLIKSLP